LPFVVAYMFRASQPARFLNDFKKAYYPAGEAALDGNIDALYDTFPPTFTNIPIVAWLFAPFALLEVDAAGILFTTLGLGAVLAAVWLSIKYGRLTSINLVWFVGVVAFNGPMYNSIREGNTTHFVWLAIIAGMMLAEARRATKGGLLFGISAVMKPPLGLVSVPWLFRAMWAPFVAFAATCAGIALLSLLLYGWDVHRAWYERCVQPFAREPLGASSVQSLDAVLARLVVGDEYLSDFEPIARFGTTFWMVRVALAGAIALGSVAVCLRWRAGDAGALVRQEICIAICIAILIAPTSWAHYYLLLLIPVALALGRRLGIPDRPEFWMLLAVSIALISPPVVALDSQNEAVRAFMGHVGFSHYFVGGLLMLVLLLAGRVASQAAAEASPREPSVLRR
jgi:hypothetical protein